MRPDPSQPDLAWRSYSGWTMIPSFLLCIGLTVVLLMSRWFFDEARSLVEQFSLLGLFGVTWAIWLVQLFRWFYRGSTYVYRLTPQFIFIDRGFLYMPEPPIPLAEVTKVEWGTDLFGRYTGIGWVSVYISNREIETMTGILRPAAFAEEIEAIIKKVVATPT